MPRRQTHQGLKFPTENILTHTDLFFMFVPKLLLCYDYYRTKTPRILAVFCILGTFSHTSRCPIACVLRTCLLDGSAAVKVSQSCGAFYLSSGVS